MSSPVTFDRDAGVGGPLRLLTLATIAAFLGSAVAHAAPAAAVDAASAPRTKAAAAAARTASGPRPIVGKDGKEVVPPKWGERMVMPPSAHIATGMPGSGNLALRDANKRPEQLVDINSASVAQLKTLPGVGDVEAQRIVAGRPYLTKAALVEKNVLPMGPFVSLRNHVYAGHPPDIAARLAGKAGTPAQPASAAGKPATAGAKTAAAAGIKP